MCSLVFSQSTSGQSPSNPQSSRGADVQGSQSTKSRSTINYSGRKLRQQKGTGKARVGDAGSGIRMSHSISWYASTNNQDVVVPPSSHSILETTPNSFHVKSELSVYSLLYLPNSRQVSCGSYHPSRKQDGKEPTSPEELYRTISPGHLSRVVRRR